MNYNLFGGNAPSPFENPMLKAAGVTAPVVNPIQNAAEVNQANNAAASDPLAIVSAPSAATLKNISALKADSRAPVTAPVQPVKAPVQPVNPFLPVKAPVQPTGMLGLPAQPINPFLPVKAPIAAQQTAKELKAEQVSKSVLDESFRSAEQAVAGGWDASRNQVDLWDIQDPWAEPYDPNDPSIHDPHSPNFVWDAPMPGSRSTDPIVDFFDTSLSPRERWLKDQEIRAEAAKLTVEAKDYVLDNTLPFDMTEKVGKAEGKRRRDIVNAFITTPEFTQGYEAFEKAARARGATETKGYLQRAYANANGIQNSYNLYMGNDGLFKYDEHKTSALSNLVKVAVVGGLTMGIGATLAPAFAGLGSLSVPATNAIAQATVNGLVAAAQGGDLSDVLTSATLGGVGKYATGLSEAAEAATAVDTIGGLGDIAGFNDSIGSMGTISAETASLAAKAEIANRVVSGLQGIQAIDEGNVLGGVTGVAGASGMFSGDTLSKIETGADTIKAVEDKDILGVVSGGLKLADLKAPQEYAEDYLTKEFKENDWVMNNVTPLSKASLSFVDDLTKGDSFEDAAVGALSKYAKSGGGLSQLLPDFGDEKSDSFEIPLDFLDPLLELGRQIDKNILQPVKDDVTTVVRETGRAIREAAPDIDIDLPDVDTSGFKLPSLDLDIDLPSLNLPSLSLPDLGLDFSGLDIPDFNMPDIDLPDFNMPDIDISLPDFSMPAIDLPDLSMPAIDLPDLSMPDIDINMPDLSLPDFSMPEWESSPNETTFSDSYSGLDIDAPELNLAFNASAGREAERTANAERTRAEDFDRLDISNYFSNPLLR